MQRTLLFVFLLSPVLGVAQPAGNPPVQTAAQTAEPPAPAVQEAEAAIGRSEWKVAAAKLDLWLAAHPADARALFDAGYVADAENRSEDALGLYRRSVEADPQRFEAQISLGLLLARLNRSAEARPYLDAATKLDPGEANPAMKARAWRALAQIDRTANASQASAELMQALKISPETTEDTLFAAELAERADQPEEAEAAYLRVLAKDPHSTPANAGLAHLLIADKQYPEAERFLRAALEESPNDTVLTAQLVSVLAGQDKAEALPLAQKLHEDHPQDASLTSLLATLLAEAGDFSGSDHLFQQLLAASPDDPALLVSHGQNLVRQMKYAEAYGVFEKAVRLAPSNPDAWSGLAFAASRTERPAMVLQALEKRAQFLPEVPSTYFLWATAYDKLHQNPQAVDYYHRFLTAAAGKFPDQEWQAKQRLLVLEKKH